MKVQVRLGDITEQPDIDAIVNAANTDLVLGSGVAGAIRRKGGDVIDEEARRKGPVRLGDVVITTAGNLPNRYVIHAAAMGYRPEDRAVPKRPGTGSSAEIIRLATINSLERAEEAGLKSIAFPALATGVAGFPVDECAEVMIGAVGDYASKHPGTVIDLVVFVLFTQNDYAVFKRSIEK
jgi:O-acetyl-ADP-ribose deacetylase